MNYVIAYALGAASCYIGIWLSTHPDDRKALFSRVKGWFKPKAE